MFFLKRGFSEEEKRQIKMQLIAEFKEGLKHKNISEISVDFLVKQVGISKGSFYNFYESKEFLFVDVVNDVQKEMVNNLYVISKERDGSPKELLKQMIYSLYKHVEDYPWVQRLSSIEYEKSIRKLPSEIRAALIKEDQIDISDIFKHLGVKPAYSIEDTTLLLQMLLFSVFSREQFGEDFERAFKLLTDAVVDKVIESEEFTVDAEA